MAWKPKEKQLTPEETIELARKELAPFWTLSDPLLGAVRSPDGRASVHPLVKSFDAKAWVILFADLTLLSGEAVLQHAREWYKRYATHDLGFLLFVKQSYKCYSTLEALQPLLRRFPLNFTIALDSDGLLFEAFGAKAGLPRALLLHQRKILSEHSGSDWLKGTEASLQSFLRIKDPGLPLSPVVKMSDLPKDTGQIELGKSSQPMQVSVSGKWSQDDEKIVTSDPAASLSFRAPSPRVSVIAQSALKTSEPTRVRVELSGDTVFEAAAGPDLGFGDDGGSEILVSDAQVYHFLVGLPAKNRDITLRFPDADRLPVALYGIRFSSN